MWSKIKPINFCYAIPISQFYGSLIKGAQYSLIIHEVLVAMGVFLDPGCNRSCCTCFVVHT